MGMDGDDMIRLFSRFARNRYDVDALLRERAESLRIKQARQRQDGPTRLQVSVNAADAEAYLRGERVEKVRQFKIGGGR